MTIIGINDIGVKCCGKHFRECRIVFRCKTYCCEAVSKVRLSNLINPRVAKCKSEVICYCDGLASLAKPSLPKPTVNVEAELPSDIELEDIELEDMFRDCDYLEMEDEKERLELIYARDKQNWIRTFSKDSRLAEAIDLGYDCDEAYLSERVQQEYPGFSFVDYTTILYKSSFPSREAMNFEKQLKSQIGQYKVKYGTYVRIGVLEEHSKINRNYEEIIIIFNYLNKFDIFATLPVIKENLKWLTITT